MRRVVEWVLIAGAALLLVGLIAYARGQKHHEGDEVGSHGTRIFLIASGANSGGTTTTSGQTTTPTDPAVADLQYVLTRLGYYTGPIDGVYSAETTAAVAEMQKALGVPADGVYGPETDAALKGKAREVVAELQTLLTEYGYYTGTIDGKYGTDTQEAVKKLQTDLGVTADGRVGAETVDAFNKAVANGTLKPTTTPTTTTPLTTTGTTSSPSTGTTTTQTTTTATTTTAGTTTTQ
jgi:peptidoglycan hydrolase-like protein with peptidoglycan-binding domain